MIDESHFLFDDDDTVEFYIERYVTCSYKMSHNVLWIVYVYHMHWRNAPLPHSLQWRHNGHDGVSNHQPCDCLLSRLFRRWSKKTSKLRVTGLCAGNSPVTSEFPAQWASNAKNVSIWWRHHANHIDASHVYTECHSVFYIYAGTYRMHSMLPVLMPPPLPPPPPPPGHTYFEVSSKFCFKKIIAYVIRQNVHDTEDCDM